MRPFRKLDNQGYNIRSKPKKLKFDSWPPSPAAYCLKILFREKEGGNRQHRELKVRITYLQRQQLFSKPTLRGQDRMSSCSMICLVIYPKELTNLDICHHQINHFVLLTILFLCVSKTCIRPISRIDSWILRLLGLRDRPLLWCRKVKFTGPVFLLILDSPTMFNPHYTITPLSQAKKSRQNQHPQANRTLKTTSPSNLLKKPIPKQNTIQNLRKHHTS